MKATVTKFEDRRRRHEHWLVTVSYGDKRKFGRVYSDIGKAERFAARQERSPVVKSTSVVKVVSSRVGRHPDWTLYQA